MQRRELFKRFVGASKKDAPKPIDPPYFSGKFDDCISCEAPCVSACERELLVFKDNRIEFRLKELGCNFCQDCAKACEMLKKDVLNLKYPAKIPAKISIDLNTCLAWNNTICYNCLDACKYRAIDFLGVFRPMINQKCVGCAECFSVCFKNSLKMESL